MGGTVISQGLGTLRPLSGYYFSYRIIFFDNLGLLDYILVAPSAMEFGDEPRGSLRLVLDRGVATGVYRYIYPQNQSTLKKIYVAVLIL